MLCFGGQPAKPFAMIDGQRFDVVQQGRGETMKQFVVDQGQQLQIKGNDDKSVSLLAPDGHEARRIAPGGFDPQGDRNPTSVFLLLIGLALVVVGNGFFKPNISTIVGTLYADGDRRRDAGFTIFYMGINLGSLFSQILCPLLAVGMGSWGGLGWWAGFALAAAGMMVSWMLIQFDGGKLDGYGDRPEGAPSNRDYVIYAGAVLVIPVVYFLFSNLMSYVAPPPSSGLIGYFSTLPIMGKIMFGSFLISVPGILIWSAIKGSRVEFQMMVAAMVLITFNTVFWTLFEQAGSSLTLFADRNTDLSVFGLFSISAGQTQFFNAAFIVLLAPLFSMMWNGMARRGIEPTIPIKFGIALMGVGAGFLFLVWGAQYAGPDFKVGLWWLAGLYLIHSIAELCISPVGLSMITKLSIARIVGLDDGRMVPVDRSGAICRGRGRAICLGRDGRRAGHQPWRVASDLCRGVLEDRLVRDRHRGHSAGPGLAAQEIDARRQIGGSHHPARQPDPRRGGLRRHAFRHVASAAAGDGQAVRRAGVPGCLFTGFVRDARLDGVRLWTGASRRTFPVGPG